MTDIVATMNSATMDFGDITNPYSLSDQLQNEILQCFDVRDWMGEIKMSVSRPIVGEDVLPVNNAFHNDNICQYFGKENKMKDALIYFDTNKYPAPTQPKENCKPLKGEASYKALERDIILAARDNGFQIRASGAGDFRCNNYISSKDVATVAVTCLRFSRM